jgi:hypothetical protein
MQRLRSPLRQENKREEMKFMQNQSQKAWIEKTKNFIQKGYLQEIGKIRKEYDKTVEQLVDADNIFKILKVEKRELSHSGFIANLLNPHAFRGNSYLFLRIFLETAGVKEKEFALENIDVKTEYKLNNGAGAIDICIKNSDKKIFIENKIKAGDQKTQLKRYSEDKPIRLFYLTLDGHDASAESRDGLKKGDDYYCISYKKEILEWLKKCLKESGDSHFLIVSPSCNADCKASIFNCAFLAICIAIKINFISKR